MIADSMYLSKRDKRPRQRPILPTTPNKYAPLLTTTTTTTTTTPSSIPGPRVPRGRGMRIRSRNARLLLEEVQPSVHFLAGLFQPSPNSTPVPSPGSPDHLINLESGEEDSRRTSSSSSSSSSFFNSGNFHLFTPSASTSVSRQVSKESFSTASSSSDMTDVDKCDPRLCKLNLVEK